LGEEEVNRVFKPRTSFGKIKRGKEEESTFETEGVEAGMMKLQWEANALIPTDYVEKELNEQQTIHRNDKKMI
jgi:hypothetical protein